MPWASARQERFVCMSATIWRECSPPLLRSHYGRWYLYLCMLNLSFSKNYAKNLVAEPWVFQLTQAEFNLLVETLIKENSAIDLVFSDVMAEAMAPLLQTGWQCRCRL